MLIVPRDEGEYHTTIIGGGMAIITTDVEGGR